MFDPFPHPDLSKERAKRRGEKYYFIIK